MHMWAACCHMVGVQYVALQGIPTSTFLCLKECVRAWIFPSGWFGEGALGKGARVVNCWLEKQLGVRGESGVRVCTGVRLPCNRLGAGWCCGGSEWHWLLIRVESCVRACWCVHV